MERNSYRNLLALASCLNGSIPEKVDWDEVIKLANKSLTITSLAAAIAKLARAENIPGDVQAYLATLHDRNAQRNSRLLHQLKEAVTCLNSAGIEPVVMKGAAILLAQKQGEIGARILTDLDVLVRPADMSGAITALRGIGYEIRIAVGSGSWPGNPKFHLPAVLARPTDVGSIDLQCRPRGPASFSDIEWLYHNSIQMAFDGADVFVPSPFAQIVYLMLHDQFQDGDYWRGLIDLRHLLDVANLARLGDISWDALRSLFANGYERNAVDTQILTAAALFGMSSMSKPSFGALSHLQLARRKIQIGRRYLVAPFTLLTLLTEVFHYSSWDRFGGDPYSTRLQEAKRKVRELRRIFRPTPPGKV
jgi:hypothetical protein